MTLRPLLLVFLLGPLLVITACFAAKPCYSPEEAADHAGKEICLSAHVYDVSETADGTRYLDLCSPETAENACHFTVISMPEDRGEVGSLDALRNQDMHLRGVVHTMHGQSMMVLSHARQLHDGPEKFRPNPELLAGFSAGNAALGFRDPAMNGHKQRSSSLFKGSTSTVRATSAPNP